MPNPLDALKNALALRGPQKDRIFGLPGNVWGPPGSGSDIAERDVTREGLPGTSSNPGLPSDERNWWTGTSTPVVDPRLIDPNANPMASIGEMRRGDIDLDTGYESAPHSRAYTQAAIAGLKRMLGR